MKNALPLLLISLLWACSGSRNEHSSDEGHTLPETSEAKPKSPKQMAMASIGDTHVHIEYSSPGKRGRTIFGGLVAYNEVWVTGAHKATSINFHNPVRVGGVDIEAGKYAIFTIPGEKEWTIIINTNWDQHLADEYDQVDDIVRLTVIPQLLEEVVESLTYEVISMGDNKGKIRISWDLVAVEFEIEES